MFKVITDSSLYFSSNTMLLIDSVHLWIKIIGGVVITVIIIVSFHSKSNQNKFSTI